jgi:hypothetical protein
MIIFVKLFDLYRVVLMAGIMVIMNQDAMANPLESYQWKNRLILASVPAKEEGEKLAALLLSNRSKLDERNLVVLNVSLGSAPIPGTIRLDPSQTNLLREEFKLSASKTAPSFVLIGKDGGEKARHTGDLNLARWLDLIDEMPMRREELRQ